MIHEQVAIDLRNDQPNRESIVLPHWGLRQECQDLLPPNFAFLSEARKRITILSTSIDNYPPSIILF
jgi:hypothetical protein